MDQEYKLKPEEKLILLCCRNHLELEIQEKIKNILMLNLDWDYIFNLATVNKLRSFLYGQLNNLCPEIIPEDIMVLFKENFERNTKKNLYIISELLSLMTCFESENLTAIPYKGPILSIIAYQNYNYREFDDLDFFIDLADIKKFKIILSKKGYINKLKLDAKQELAYFKFQREYSFRNSIPLEIKWKIVPGHFSFIGNKNFPINCPAKTVKINKHIIKTFSNEVLIMILSIHNVSHFWNKLSAICDISEVISSDKSFQWPLLIQIAEDIGMTRILFVNLDLANKLFELEIPNDILRDISQETAVKKISDRIILSFFSGQRFNRFDKFIIKIRIREHFINKLKDSFNYIFLPTTNVIQVTKLSKHLFFLYYLLRAFQLMKNIISDIK